MEELLSKCKEASKKLQLLTEDDVNKCLLNIKDALIKNKDFIFVYMLWYLITHSVAINFFNSSPITSNSLLPVFLPVAS